MLSKLGFALVLAGLLGCGGLQTGKVPVDSPLNEFEAPEEDELVDEAGEGDDAWDIDEDDEPETADVGEPEAEPAKAPANAPGEATGAGEAAGAAGAKAAGGKPGKAGKKKAQGAAQAEKPAAAGN